MLHIFCRNLLEVWSYFLWKLRRKAADSQETIQSMGKSLVFDHMFIIREDFLLQNLGKLHLSVSIKYLVRELQARAYEQRLGGFLLQIFLTLFILMGEYLRKLQLHELRKDIFSLLLSTHFE